MTALFAKTSLRSETRLKIARLPGCKFFAFEALIHPHAFVLALEEEKDSANILGSGRSYGITKSMATSF